MTSPNSSLRSRFLRKISAYRMACATCLLFPVVLLGCSQPQKSTGTGPIKLDNSKENPIILALAFTEFTKEKCSRQILDKAPAQNTVKYSARDTLLKTIKERTGSRVIEFCQLGITLNGEDAGNIEAICDQLTSKGYKGNLLIAEVYTSEMFGLGCSAGAIDLKLELWDTRRKQLSCKSQENEVHFTPIFWVANFHDLSGKLNKRGLQAMQAVIRKSIQPREEQGELLSLR